MRLPLALFVGLVLAAPGVAAPIAPILRPAVSLRVESLVAQLGSDRFRERDAAEQALTQLGPDVFAVVDRLPPPTDPEVRVRLARVRRALLGFLDDIRAGLATIPVRPDHDLRAEVPEWLVNTVRKHQPRSGDLVLSLVKDRKHPQHRAAVAVYVRCWEDMPPSNLKAYVREVMTASAFPRPHYPKGVEGAVEMRHWLAYGWSCWPDQNKLKFTARSQHFVDGKPSGKPYTYNGPGATTGWIPTKDLAVGKHTCSMEVQYTFTHRGETVTDTIRSAEYAFTMRPEGTPDDLIAPFDAATDKLVRQAVVFRNMDSETENAIRAFRQFDVLESTPSPSVMWKTDKGQWDGLVCPQWHVTQTLPVDLCFDVELHDLKAKKVHACDPAVRLKGETGGSYLTPRDAQAFAKGRAAGDIQVRVVLKPSRKWALYNPEVTSYFPGEVKSPPLTLTVVRDYKMDRKRFDW